MHCGQRPFPFLDVRFVAINDNFDTLTAERNSDGYIIPLKNIINAAYSKDISRKIIPALAGKQQRGEFIGAWAAYGYRRCADDPHRIEPDEETAPVVRKIFEWRRHGMSHQQITRALNELLIPCPSRYLFMCGLATTQKYADTVWNVMRVKNILKNGVYRGDMVQGRKRSGFPDGQKKQKYLPKEEWTVVRGTHEPLVDEETFEIVQRIAEEKKAVYNERLGKYEHLGTSPNILRGLIFCADCKRPLVRYKSVTNKGRNLSYVWICQTHSDNPESCPKKYFQEKALMDILWNTIRHEIGLASELSLSVKKAEKSKPATERENALNREETEVQRAYDKAKMLYEGLYANYVDKLLTEQEYTTMKAQYRAEMEQAKERISLIRRQRESLQTKTVKNPWLSSFAGFHGATELTEDIAHALIERVEIRNLKEIT